MKLEILNALDYKGILKELSAPISKEHMAIKLSELKIPNKKSEKYRYFDIESLTKKEFNSVVTTKDTKPQTSNTLIEIKNGSLEKVCLAKGVEVSIDEFGDIDNDHFDALYYTSHLISSKVIKIRVSKDAEFEIKHITTQKDALIDYRVVVFVDNNVNATIYETFDIGQNNSFILSGYDIFIAPYATLNFYKNKSLNSSSDVVIFSNYYKIDSDATFNLGTYDFVSENFLNIFKAELMQRANINATHLLYTNSNCKGGTVSEIVHIGKSAKSTQNAKNILNSNSRGIFDALIRVTNTAKGAIAHQNSKAILLDSSAYMASKPQLEIYIDELEASHGSTTGQLDKRALFYLRSRGINKIEAKKMLILAFANEAIDAIKNSDIANHIKIDFEKAYYGSSEIECIKTCHECEEVILKD